MFWSTPSNRPPANAIGIERSPPSATAAREPRTMSVNCASASWNSGAIRMPPNPASIIVSTHAAADVRASLTPRMPARSPLSTTARISRPSLVLRNTIHSATAARNAATNTAIWSEFNVTPCSPMKSRWYVSRGCGPSPRTAPPPVPLPVVIGRPRSRTVLPSDSTSHSAIDGSAMRRPIVPTIRGVHRRGREPAQEDPVEREAEERREDDDRQDRRRDDVDALTEVELEEEVRRHERDRAVGEVEDARRLVGEDQPRRHDGVDAAGHGAGQQQVEELFHYRMDLIRRPRWLPLPCRSLRSGPRRP